MVFVAAATEAYTRLLYYTGQDLLSYHHIYLNRSLRIYSCLFLENSPKSSNKGRTTNCKELHSMEHWRVVTAAPIIVYLYCLASRKIFAFSCFSTQNGTRKGDHSFISVHCAIELLCVGKKYLHCVGLFWFDSQLQ